MSFKVIAGLFLCGVYLCPASAVPAPTGSNVVIGDDRANWEAVYKETKDQTDISRSGDPSIFDAILTINAKERGGGVARSDDNVFLFEGDISMNKSEAIKIVQGSSAERRRRAVGNTGSIRLWPKNVPYAISRSLSGVAPNIRRAIQEWETTLRCMGGWRDVTRLSKPRNYMYFIRGQGCYSQVGLVRSGGQRISIGNGCERHGVIVHEIGHAMGLWHEQSRPDRDKFVTIMWNNIIPAMRFNFQKKSSSSINSYGIGYDYGSVMHYGEYAFSRYRGRKTIESKPRGKQLGQRYGLSAKDKQQVRKLYNCDGTTPAGCKDVQSAGNCNYWKGLGFCEDTYVAFMEKNCCNTCGSSVVITTTPAPCLYVDKNSNCPAWKKEGYCGTSDSRYYRYMSANCAKSCRC